MSRGGRAAERGGCQGKEGPAAVGDQLRKIGGRRGEDRPVVFGWEAGGAKAKVRPAREKKI